MAFFVLLGLVDLVKGAVTVADITDTQYSSTLSSSVVSWRVEMIAGFPSVSTMEIAVTANGIASASHSWSYPEQIGIDYDSMTGNLEVRAGSTVITRQPTIGFNALLVRISDFNFQEETTQLKNSVVNNVNVRNLFAAVNASGRDYDQVLITGISNNQDLVFASQFIKGQYAVDHDSELIVTAITIPEPSNLVLWTFSVLILFRRRRF